MEHKHQNTTIFAVSSGKLPSGVAIIRISGPLSLYCLSKLSGKSISKPKALELRNLYYPYSKKLIDQCMVVWFQKPNSFTGEDVVELHCHGSIAVIEAVTKILSEINFVRIAEPGEFTKIAFFNQKLNMDQVEGLADLINSETTMQLAQAHNFLRGDLGKLSNNIRESLIGILSKLEAFIEFEDEGVSLESLENINLEITNNINHIKKLVNNYENGRAIREGFVVAIVGAPNVGKSSIINRIANNDVAIVTNEPGTTRDIVEVKINLYGFPIYIQDTAGIRSSNNKIEKLGIEKTIDSINNADLILYVSDSSSSENDQDILDKLSGKNYLQINNKSDVVKYPEDQEGILLSAETGEGFDNLFESLKNIIIDKTSINSDSFLMLARQRHYDIFRDILNSLDNFLKQDIIELKADDLSFAIRLLGKITGRVDLDHMLDKLFSEFCIGK